MYRLPVSAVGRTPEKRATVNKIMKPVKPVQLVIPTTVKIVTDINHNYFN